MQSFENFKKNVCLTLEDQINRFAKSVPPDQSLDFNNTINKALSYFLFDNNNEIKSLSHLNFVLGNQIPNMSANSNKSYPEIKKDLWAGEIMLNPNDLDLDLELETNYQLELDFYWYLQKQFNANYISICELETIGERIYFTSKFLNLTDKTEFKDITEVTRNINDGQLIFNKKIMTEDKSKILDNLPGILELFLSRINCNWSAKKLTMLNDIYIKKFQNSVGTFNTDADKRNTFSSDLDNKIKHKLVLELMATNGRKVSEATNPKSPEYRIVSTVDKIRLLQAENIPIYHCIIELESQSLWSTSIDDDIILKKELDDFISGSRIGTPDEASQIMFKYITFRIKLDFPNILSEEQIFINIAMTVNEFKKQNLMI
jgi:hypothetical protein